jgi:CheY-like chemotaxis protein
MPGILVVDDDPLLRMLLNLGLRHHGFRVWQAGGGREAVAVYRQHGALIDLVLLDVRMPDLDGPHTLTALQEVKRSVRVCFLCACAEGDDPNELVTLGVVGVLAKPFRLDGLVQALEHLAAQPLSAPSPDAACVGAQHQMQVACSNGQENEYLVDRGSKREAS